jgi:hypothetical protein
LTRIDERDGRFVYVDHKPVRLQQKNKRISFHLIVDANNFLARRAPQPLFDG